VPGRRPVAAVDPALMRPGKRCSSNAPPATRSATGAKNGTGPMLNGIVGRAVGQVEGFKYSKPMADAGAGGMIWDDATLACLSADPKGFIPKNKMAFNGLKKEADIAASSPICQFRPSDMASRALFAASALPLRAPCPPLAEPSAMPNAGPQLFERQCKACHQIGPGAINRVGPRLNGIFGRKAARWRISSIPSP
jgi:cytochrome c2